MRGVRNAVSGVHLSALVAGCIVAESTRGDIYAFRESGGEFMIVRTDAIDKDVLRLDNSIYLEDVDQYVVFARSGDGSWQAEGADDLARRLREQGRLLRRIDYRGIARVERGKLVLPRQNAGGPAPVITEAGEGRGH